VSLRLYSFVQFENSFEQPPSHFAERQREELLQVVLTSSDQRLKQFAQGHILWRAQVAHEDAATPIKEGSRMLFERPASEGRMIPLKGCAQEGRANAKDDPVLYCATDRGTAIAEVRPWIEAIVTVAQLSLRRCVHVVDCSGPSRPYPLEDIREPEDAVNDLWSRINNAFSQPVARSDSHSDYVATQFLAAAFRKRGYDGIVYRSRVEKGCNFALFDLDVAQITDRDLFWVKALSVTTEPLHMFRHLW
jgi:hypothetical protein